MNDSIPSPAADVKAPENQPPSLASSLLPLDGMQVHTYICLYQVLVSSVCVAMGFHRAGIITKGNEQPNLNKKTKHRRYLYKRRRKIIEQWCADVGAD